MIARTELPVVTCEGCGACCMHMAVPPYDEEEMDMLKEWHPGIYAEMQAIYATRKVQFRLTDADSVPCAFFDWATRQCRHHEQKPDICARFEVGGEFCLSIRKDAGL